VEAKRSVHTCVTLRLFNAGLSCSYRCVARSCFTRSKTVVVNFVISTVCPSVRHTPVLCVNGYTYPRFIYHRVSPTILVFQTKRDGNIQTSTSETVRGTDIVSVEYMPYSTVSFRMTLSDPPSPLLPVPNVTAHPSTASVPTSYYLMWHYCLWTVKG